MPHLLVLLGEKHLCAEMRVCSLCHGSGHNRRTCNGPASSDPSAVPAANVLSDRVPSNIRCAKEAAELLHVLDKYMVLKVTSPSQYENYLKDTAAFLVQFAQKAKA